MVGKFDDIIMEIVTGIRLLYKMDRIRLQCCISVVNRPLRSATWRDEMLWCVTFYISKIDYRSQVTQIIKHRIVAKSFQHAISSAIPLLIKQPIKQPTTVVDRLTSKRVVGIYRHLLHNI